MLVGTLTSVGGVVTSFYADTPSGATIVLLAIAVFVVSATLVTAPGCRPAPSPPHGRGP
nr:metal ABC transporter permease [Janibacter limosus]